MKSESGILARRYARALSAAFKTEELPAVISELAAVNSAVVKCPAFSNPAISKAAKKNALAGVVKNKILQNFLNLLVDNKRLDILGAAADETRKILNQKTGTLEAEIIFANTPRDKTEIENILKKMFKAQKIAAVYKEDKSLIAGVKINAGGFCIDGSVKNNLEKLKTVLEA